jgi:eukaryotic-like serine/threonine-protein kinase
MTTLAAILEGLGRHDESSELYSQASTKAQAIGGEVLLDFLGDTLELIEALRCSKRFPEAIDLARRVLKGREDVLGAQHHHTVKAIWWLASTLDSSQQDAEALEMYKMAYYSFTELVGVDHPDTRDCRVNWLNLLDNIREDRTPDASLCEKVNELPRP